MAIACFIVHAHTAFAQWEQAGALNSGKITSLLLCGNRLFAGTDTGGLFVSSNNGESWAPVDSGLSNLKIRALASTATTLYAGTYGRGIFRSTDNGRLWTSTNAGLTDSFVTALA
jgi:ligand-binding sensor domain-containing protein